MLWSVPLPPVPGAAAGNRACGTGCASTSDKGGLSCSGKPRSDTKGYSMVL